MGTRARRKRQAWKQSRQQKTQEMNTTHEPYLACGHPMRRGTSATLQTALTTWAIFTGLLQALRKGWAHLVHRPPAGAPAASSEAKQAAGRGGNRGAPPCSHLTLSAPPPASVGTGCPGQSGPPAPYIGTAQRVCGCAGPHHRRGELGGSQAAGPFSGGSR